MTVESSLEADVEGLLARITGDLEGGSGYDSLGRDYAELRDLWEAMGLLSHANGRANEDEEEEEEEEQQQQQQQQRRRQEEERRPAWYSHAFDYWEAERNCPATVDGVLGGFGHVSPRDIAGSQAFVEKLRQALPTLKLGRVVDCGAGIGRVTRHLLLPLFEKVDLLEQSPRLLAAAPAYLSGAGAAAAGEERRVGEEGEEVAAAAATAAAAAAVVSQQEKGREEEEDVAARVSYMCGGMQDFDPADGSYDVVWIQWCVGHLHDLDLLRFLRRCKRALVGTGCVVVKDNCCADVDFVLDKEDSSVTRSPAYLKALFRIAGYDLRLEQRQHDFPAELLPVYMFAFTPRSY